jgi:peptidyl-prolyl cis-trans isomerase A (cyclophilin A)
MLASDNMRTLLTLLAISGVTFAQTAATHASPKASAATHHAAPKTVDATQTYPTDPGLYVAFNTTEGRIVCKLYETEAPVTVKNFTSLARGLREFTDPKTKAKVKRPFYNGLTFHRVIPGFMIQGGDPTGSGMGDGGVPTIIDEFASTLKFDEKGRLAMANTGRPHTGGVQFFITDSTPENLNGKHTIFGQVVSGQDVVTKITQVPRDANDKPTTPVVMKSVLIHRVGLAPGAKAPVKAAAKS